MSVGRPWSRRFRSGMAVWAILSAMGGPLLSGYHFLSSSGRLPGAPEEWGFLTIVANAGLMTVGLLWLGVLVTAFFITFATRDEKLWITIAKALLLVLLILTFRVSEDQSLRPLWMIFLILLICLVTPVAKYVDKYDLKLMAVLGSGLIVLMFIVPDWMKGWWMSFSKQPEFRLIPLSEMSFGDWFLAVVGAGVYVWAYVEFQQWRTDGKWLDEIKKRLRGDA